jgi:hypothetical protein
MLLDENFDDVTGLPRANLVRPLNNILLNDPLQLPSGTTWFAPSASNINVRRGDDLINISNSTYGFDSFFTPTTDNKFLVIGDNSGSIGDMPTSGLMSVSFPFSLRPTTASITVSYKYAFDGFDDILFDDVFSAFITDGIESILLDSYMSPDTRRVGSAGNIASGIFTTEFFTAVQNNLKSQNSPL